MKLTQKQIQMIRFLASGENQKTAGVKAGLKAEAARSALFLARKRNGMKSAVQLAVECVKQGII